MNHYQQRLEAKRERLQAAAERAALESDRVAEASRSHVSGIPFGQPILVGHHSEKRHRRDIKRSWRGMGRSVELAEKAKRLEERAEAVGSGGISSDDPDAPAALTAKLEDLLATWEASKAFNVRWRKAGRPTVDEAPEFWAAETERDPRLATGAMRHIRYSVTAEGRVYSWVKGLSLTGYSAEAKRIRGRLAELEKLAKRAEAGPKRTEYAGGYAIEECPDDNRVRFELPGRPTPERKAELRRAGMRWAPSVGAWSAYLNAAWKVYQLAEEWGLEAE